ncbi:MAG: carbamate kinase [Deltaproteobacteria bacterium]|jgi:carbamate kinase|nr:carbamate kinase [Deltaproteobacteria bacterium]
MEAKLAFIAIGGNSLIKSKNLQTVADQHHAIRDTVSHVADLIEQGYQVVISHGNGPQVGFIMLRSEVARRETGLHLVPLVNVVADTQGSIGYQIQQSLNNELAARGQKGQSVTVVTQVVVDKEDPGFKNPAKPVGEFYDADQIENIRRDYPDWSLVPDAGRGFRRVVPSPEPLEVVERPVIESLLKSGYHVVAAGGGGIPVVRTDQGLEGVDAVVDKDLASAMLACQLGADLLIISTAVEQVVLNFGTPDARGIDKMTVDEAEQYIAEGHFAPGSMLPKIQSALRFLKNGGHEVIITAPEFIKAAVNQGKGTHIVP